MPAVYDKFAHIYDRLFEPLERRFLSSWREETLKLLPAHAAILELGAGTGSNFRFYPESRLAVASEISAGMLHQAAAKQRNNLLVLADAGTLPFEANVFDAAFATLVFCSVPEPFQAFRELERVVRLGGTVILLEHVRPPGLLGYVFDFINVFTAALIDDHFNRRTAELAAEAGLKVTAVRRKAAGAVNLIVCEVVK